MNIDEFFEHVGERLLAIQGAVDNLDRECVVGPKLWHAERAQKLCEELRAEVKSAKEAVRR